MDIVAIVIWILVAFFYVVWLILQICDSYKRYHEVTGNGFFKYFFSLDRACSVFFTDDNYDKLNKLSKEKCISIDLLLNNVVSSFKDSEGE